jgi:pimeloyl-ACP methyl ester carboxylesterase
MPFANFDNFQLYYEIHGEGEPLVLISGFASGAWIWFEQIKQLSKHFRVIIFDSRGVSRSKISDKEIGSVNIETIADDITRILDDLNIKKTHILGASYGGFVAQEFAINHPERLNKLVLVCTSFGGVNHVSPDLDVMLAFASTEAMNSSERIKKFMKPAFTKEFIENKFNVFIKVCELRSANPVPLNVYSQQLVSATTFDLQKYVRHISAETLVITGGFDQIVPMQNSVNLSNLIPNATLEVVENGSHLFFIEQAEKFNKIVTEFLAAD